MWIINVIKSEILRAIHEFTENLKFKFSNVSDSIWHIHFRTVDVNPF